MVDIAKTFLYSIHFIHYRGFKFNLFAAKLKEIPFSDNTIGRRIQGMVDDIRVQLGLINRLKEIKCVYYFRVRELLLRNTGPLSRTFANLCCKVTHHNILSMCTYFW